MEVQLAGQYTLTHGCWFVFYVLIQRINKIIQTVLKKNCTAVEYDK